MSSTDMPEAQERVAPIATPRGGEIQAYDPIEADLAKVEHEMKGVVHDLTTKAGEEIARRDLGTLVKMRTALERARKATKEASLRYGERVDAEAKRIKARIEALEKPIADRIEQLNKEREEAAERKRQEIQARIDAMRAKIAETFALPKSTPGGPRIAAVQWVDARARIEAVSVTSEVFGDLVIEAQDRRVNALQAIDDALLEQRAYEEEQAELAKRRAELKAEEEAAAKRRAEEAAERERQRKADDEERARRQKAEDEERARLRAEEDAREAKRRAERQLEDERMEAQRAQARKADEQRTQAEAQVNALEYQTTVAAIGRLGVRKGGTIECIRQTLEETRAWKVDDQDFGVFRSAVEGAKAKAVAEIERMLERAERAEAERLRIQKEERDAAERRRAEQLAREVMREAAETMLDALILWQKADVHQDPGELDEARQARDAAILMATGKGG